MKPVDRTAPSQREAIAFELDLPHAPEKVWRALTDPELLAEWLLPAVGFELEAGAEFTLWAPAQPGWEGDVECRLLEVEAPRRLSYTWVVGEIDTVVTFTLTPIAAGTRLTLMQSGFGPDQRRNFAGARYGWRKMGARLVDLLAGQGHPRPAPGGAA